MNIQTSGDQAAREVSAPQLEEMERGLAALPSHLHAGLRAYIAEGQRPGGFLCAIIDNDLNEAVARAGDGIGMDELRRLTRFFYNDCPSQSWRSREKRLNWEGQGGLAGAHRETARD